ncbi:MAG: hypothetical protein FWC50_01375, partial [Planctomycetaceae bacterium]|nr:hypothetical protein [Planctomycetaceae bacterium]
VTVNGQTFIGEMYVVRQMILKEISFVDLAADENTSAKVEADYEQSKPLTKKVSGSPNEQL